MLILLTIGMVSLAFNIQSTKSEWTGTVYIRADGSIDPSDAPIITADNITYTLTDNITSSADGIIVERSNIIVDGAGYTLQGSGSGNGFYWTGIGDVTIKNTNIRGFDYGIRLRGSSNNNIIENNLLFNYYGIKLDYYSDYNNIFRNNIARNFYTGISLGSSSKNSISRNEIFSNDCGVNLCSSFNNIISENNVTRNDVGIQISLFSKPGMNHIYHNNFLNNTEQVRFGYVLHYGQPITSFNFWDDGYPCGGNYWSNYTGTDFYSGAYQNETGSDGIGDTPHVIDADNQDNYPLMSPWIPPEHELIASLTAPSFTRAGKSVLLEAIVTNKGLNEEVAVKIELLINGTLVNSTTFSTLKLYHPYTLAHMWIPTTVGIYNVTTYIHPVDEETSLENNKITRIVMVGPPLKVGVEAGDWIKVEYTVTGAPSRKMPTWIKLEFLSVQETKATVKVRMHMSDGTEQHDTVVVDIVAGNGTIGTFTGFLIPANSTIGYPIYISDYGNLTIAGETTRSYAGADRTVVYVSFEQFVTQLTYYWDKQTGVMVEASAKMGGMTVTAKATETNMWQPTPIWMQWWLWPIVAVAIVALAVAIYFLKKRKPPKPTAPITATDVT